MYIRVSVRLPLVLSATLLLSHTTSELVTTEPLDTLQEREMEVADMETTLTLGWSGGGTVAYYSKGIYTHVLLYLSH